MPARDACPCGTGRPYRACCEPLHRGEREAADAEELMRSRYAAFARNDAAYLWRSLHPEHPDRGRPEGDVVRELRATAGTLRFMGLSILDRRGPDTAGLAQVLFLAKVFQKGADRSFVELSDFEHDGEGWRYLRGTTRALSRLGGEPLEMTIDEFLRAR